MLSIVLIQPETPGNIGAVARVMKNFDQKNLVLIEPKCNHLDETAIVRAKHAKDVLKKAKVKKKDFLNGFDYIIGTTSVLGTDYNIPRSPITPEQLAEKVGTRKKIALVFGREGPGLSNSEIRKCDFVVAIPTSKTYHSLNISHSVGIVLYEIYKRLGKKKINEHIVMATKTEKDQIMKMFGNVLNRMKFSTKEKKETQKTVWKKIIGKAFLTKREAYALMGFLRKLL